MKARVFLLVFAALALLQPAAILRAQIPAANGLEATNLVWTTGGTGNAGWLRDSVTALDGIDSARSADIPDNGETWLKTTVVGPGTVSFWWAADSEPNADWLEFYIGSTRQAMISGETDWEYCSFPVPAGTHELKFRYVKDYELEGTADCGWVDQLRYVSPSSPPLQQALNTSGVVWNSAGSVFPNGWLAQTNVTHDGQWAAQSGYIPNDQTNWLQTTVSGVTNVSFWWKVSSETNYDFLEFYINGVLATNISGVVDWKSNYFKLPSGTNIVTWLYRKDVWSAVGSDCGWVDQVTFGGTLRALPYRLQTPVRLPDGRMQLTVSGEVGCVCRVEYSTNAFSRTGWTQFTNFTTTSANTVVIDSGATNSPARYYRAVSP
jgi:hypothetical protein